MSTSDVPSINYRGTTLGTALLDTLDELVADGKIPAHLAMKVLEQYDKSAESKFAVERGKATVTGHLHTYRLLDDCWTMVVKDAKFRLNENDGQTPKSVVKSARAKIVAQKSAAAIEQEKCRRRR